MIDPADSVPPLTGQDRRRIVGRAGRLLADASGIGCGTVRRPATALIAHRRDRLAESTI